MGESVLSDLFSFGSDILGFVPGFQWAPLVGNAIGGGIKGGPLGALEGGAGSFAGGALGSALGSATGNVVDSAVSGLGEAGAELPTVAAIGLSGAGQIGGQLAGQQAVGAAEGAINDAEAPKPNTPSPITTKAPGAPSPGIGGGAPAALGISGSTAPQVWPWVGAKLSLNTDGSPGTPGAGG